MKKEIRCRYAWDNEAYIKQLNTGSGIIHFSNTKKFRPHQYDVINGEYVIGATNKVRRDVKYYPFVQEKYITNRIIIAVSDNHLDYWDYVAIPEINSVKEAMIERYNTEDAKYTFSIKDNIISIDSYTDIIKNIGRDVYAYIKEQKSDLVYTGIEDTCNWRCGNHASYTVTRGKDYYTPGYYHDGCPNCSNGKGYDVEEEYSSEAFRKEVDVFIDNFYKWRHQQRKLYDKTREDNRVYNRKEIEKFLADNKNSINQPFQFGESFKAESSTSDERYEKLKEERRQEEEAKDKAKVDKLKPLQIDLAARYVRIFEEFKVFCGKNNIDFTQPKETTEYKLCLTPGNHVVVTRPSPIALGNLNLNETFYSLFFTYKEDYESIHVCLHNEITDKKNVEELLEDGYHTIIFSNNHKQLLWLWHNFFKSYKPEFEKMDIRFKLMD